MPDPTQDANGSDTGTPRWVYVFAVIAIILVALFVIRHLAGGGLGNHIQ